MNKHEKIQLIKNVAHLTLQPFAKLIERFEGHVLQAILHSMQCRGACSYLSGELLVRKIAPLLSQEHPQLLFKRLSHRHILTLNKFHIWNFCLCASHMWNKISAQSRNARDNIMKKNVTTQKRLEWGALFAQTFCPVFLCDENNHSQLTR